MKSHEQCKEMGKRLKAVRQSLGITQEKMAETMDVSVRQYRRYEAGEASLPISFLDAVDTYGIDINYIGTGKLLVDLQIELGMRCMPEEDFDAVVGSISSCCTESVDIVPRELFGKVREKLEVFQNYYVEHHSAVPIREVMPFYFWTMCYEELTLKEYLDKTLLDDYKKTAGAYASTIPGKIALSSM